MSYYNCNRKQPKYLDFKVEKIIKLNEFILKLEKEYNDYLKENEIEYIIRR